MNFEEQYLQIVKDIITHGSWVKNPRTKVNCKTVLNKQITINVGNNEFPVLTTRKLNWRGAINEMVCYMRAYSNLRDFHKLGVKTWDANVANWKSRYKQSDNDAGIIYGASAKLTGVDYTYILDQIRNNPHDRGIIWNFWNPQHFPEGCLRPCMYSHQFNVIDNKLYLSSIQRLQRASLH